MTSIDKGTFNGAEKIPLVRCQACFLFCRKEFQISARNRLLFLKFFVNFLSP